MTLVSSYENPFEKFNANDMDDESILQLWVEPYSLLYPPTADLLREKTLFIEGGRGCGKTMLLRYLSFEVMRIEARKLKVSLLELVKRKRAVAFYIRVDNATLNSFASIPRKGAFRERLFAHYFELIVARAYFEFLEGISNEPEISKGLGSSFYQTASRLIGMEEPSTIRDIIAYIDSEVSRVESFRNSIAFQDVKFEPAKSFWIGQLSVGLTKLITDSLPSLRQIRMLIAIDEYENFGSKLQRLVNSMIRSSGTSVGFRLGMRYGGLKTRATVQRDEFIKENNDYQVVRFKDVLVKDQKYRKFLINLAEKRLNSVALFREAKMTRIDTILGEEHDVSEAKSIIAGGRNPLQHFSILGKAVDTPRISASIKSLRYPKNPLLEMLSIVWVLRGRDPLIVSRVMRQAIFAKVNNEDRRLVQKYHNDYTHKYKLALLFLLASLHKTNKKYYGFNIFCFLSSGIPRTFVNLCRAAFHEAYYEMGHDRLLREKQIDIKLQDEAARVVGEKELVEIKAIPKWSSEISWLARNLGKRFSEFHTDIWLRYPETNTFYVSELSRANREIFDLAQTWSVVQKKSRLQMSGPKASLEDIYTLNRIFCPLFNISYRTRGGVIDRISDKAFSRLCSSVGMEKLREVARADRRRIFGEGTQRRIDESWDVR